MVSLSECKEEHNGTFWKYISCYSLVLLVQFGSHVRSFFKTPGLQIKLTFAILYLIDQISIFLQLQTYFQFKLKCTQDDSHMSLHPISFTYAFDSLPHNPSSLNLWKTAGSPLETSIFNQSDWWQHATPSMSQTQKFSKFTRLLCQCSRGTLSAINESDNADVIVNARLQPCNCVVSY